MKARKKIKEVILGLTWNDVVHHIDGDPFNNDINNLAVMERDEHIKYHSKISEAWGPSEKSITQRFKELNSLLVLYNDGLI